MGRFSTRNSDGASSKAESANTISDKDMASLNARGARHENANEGGLLGAKATARRKAQDQSKAAQN